MGTMIGLLVMKSSMKTEDDVLEFSAGIINTLGVGILPNLPPMNE